MYVMISLTLIQGTITLLHLAVQHSNSDIINLLLEEGADVNAKSFGVSSV